MDTYFENLVVGLHVLYVFSTHVKFLANMILFTTDLYIYLFLYNFRLQKFEIKFFFLMA